MNRTIMPAMLMLCICAPDAQAAPPIASATIQAAAAPSAPAQPVLSASAANAPKSQAPASAQGGSATNPDLLPFCIGVVHTIELIARRPPVSDELHARLFQVYAQEARRNGRNVTRGDYDALLLRGGQTIANSIRDNKAEEVSALRSSCINVFSAAVSTLPPGR